ncbi:hypothetical protein EGW08_022578 [Elysia chlorotica]|uniref:CUB domain-containing protein n=1 Tax=Elysia chlorotica TaxID=188477 RepID=A0A3S1H095_ELYCH|nr:hypothetical protein EGW08_022578 [Elysia chlorotica]
MTTWPRYRVVKKSAGVSSPLCYRSTSHGHRDDDESGSCSIPVSMTEPLDSRPIPLSETEPQGSSCIPVYVRESPGSSSIPMSLRAALVMTLVLALLPASGQSRTVFSQCGGHLTAPQGIIQSPNFPGPFPVPISCRWVIHVPADSKTVIYFTQYYMRHSFYITEYDHYVGPKDYRNKILVGQIDAEDHLTTVVAYR